MAELLHFELVTPEKLAFSADVTMVEIPGEMGDFGVLPGHSPFMSMIRTGIVRIHQADGSLQSFVVPAGYAEINPQGCIVLAEHAFASSSLTREQVEAELQQARDAMAAANDDATQQSAAKRLQLAEAKASALAA